MVSGIWCKRRGVNSCDSWSGLLGRHMWSSFFVQEAHTTSVEVLFESSLLRAWFHIRGSYISQALGGVITLVSNRWFPPTQLHTKSGSLDEFSPFVSPTRTLTGTSGMCTFLRFAPR